MDYDFTTGERGFGRVVFALALDKKRMTERVVIGETQETRRRFENGGGDVFYDETRPLGSLLLGFESDKDGEWNKHGMTLRESYGKAFLFDAERWKTAAPVSDFLRRKYESGEPSAMFAAVKTWEEYLNCFNLNHGADLLTDRLSTLYRPFAVYADCRPWRGESAVATDSAIRDGESSVELWYPVRKRSFEVVVTASSFLPIVACCLHKIDEWKFIFRECKICGKDFLARSRHYELCSDECRKARAAAAKREFDERAKNDGIERLDEAAYYYWYNRLRKLRKAADPERAAAFKAAFDDFRAEAVRRKAAVKRGDTKFTEFANWLAEQRDESDRLVGEQHLYF
ncbi:MAG: hypothetical protein LBO81_04605 [Clostridiales Family XIII bacterium]|jgi:hypothetical protein|nr:hypothetical protein [Clostridiales Family XIII bacterium]